MLSCSGVTTIQGELDRAHRQERLTRDLNCTVLGVSSILWAERSCSRYGNIRLSPVNGFCHKVHFGVDPFLTE
jgi:hypothetical protein